MSTLQETVLWLVSCFEDVVHVFSLTRGEDWLRTRDCQAEHNRGQWSCTRSATLTAQFPHSSEIVCMNIKHAVVFVCFSSDSDKTAKWAEGPARAYHPHWQPKEALRWWNLVAADFGFCFFKCSVSSSAVICKSAAHCSSLSACRAAELVGGKEKWIKFKDWRAREICYIPQTKWVCLMRAHHFSVSSSWLTEHKISSKKHPQVSEGYTNT